MGVSYSPEQLAVRVIGYAESIGKANREAVTEAIKVYKNGVITQLRRDIGSEQRLSQWRWDWRMKTYRPLKFSAGYEVKGTDKAEAILLPRPRPRNPRSAGPWRVLESGARPHTIVPKPARGKALVRGGARPTRKVGGSNRLARPIALGKPGQWARFRLEHPGSRPGFQTWSKGAKGVERNAVDVYAAVQARVLREQNLS